MGYKKLEKDMHRFILAMTAIIGAKVGEIIVNTRPRRYGETKYGLSRVWNVLFDIVTIKMLGKFQHRPIWWFAFFAFIFGLFGLGFGIISGFLFLNGVRTIVYSAASFLFLFRFGTVLSWGLLAAFFVKIERR